MKPIFLDYNATTPIAPEVYDAMKPYLTEHFGNPASNHPYGWKAKEALDRARSLLAQYINAENPHAIIFTSGATESNNLALKGASYFLKQRGNHIITQKTEHSSVLETCKDLEQSGFEVTYLDTNKYGFVDPEELEKSIKPKTMLVSVMWANNEIGTIQPVSKISQICQKQKIVFHCDGAQALGKIPIDVQKEKVDLLSLSGHKVYGPKGVGALYIAQKPSPIRLKPLLVGGGQEFGFRSGTVAVHQIVGFAKASQIAVERLSQDHVTYLKLREHLWQQISNSISGAVRNSPQENCLPNTLNISFEKVDGETLMLGIPQLALSAGSACKSQKGAPSHVLKAIGLPDPLVRSSLRMSLGRSTTRAEIDQAATWILEAVSQQRAAVGVA